MQMSIISVLLSKINIAKQGHFIFIKVDYTPLTLHLLGMLEEIGIIRGYHVLKDEAKIKVILRYIHGSLNIFFKLKQVSTPGKRVYVDLLDLIKLKEREGGSVIFIISTPAGIIFDSQCLLYKVGGEILIKIVL